MKKLLDGAGRILVCTSCRAIVRVLEATVGARTSEEHQHLDPATYVCGACADEKSA